MIFIASGREVTSIQAGKSPELVCVTFIGGGGYIFTFKDYPVLGLKADNGSQEIQDALHFYKNPFYNWVRFLIVKFDLNYHSDIDFRDYFDYETEGRTFNRELADLLQTAQDFFCDAMMEEDFYKSALNAFRDATHFERIQKS